MWNCLNCSETHDDQFDACWKCGSTRDGQRNPESRLAEPVEGHAQSTRADGESPSLRLPAVTYFSIPVYLWYAAIRLLFQLADFPSARPYEWPATPAGWVVQIAVIVGTTFFIGIPIFACIVRALYRFISRRTPGGIEMLSMFLLPQEFRSKHRWFVPIYYGSILAAVLLPVACAIWCTMQMP